MAQAPSSPVPQANRDAALLQAKMNLRVLAMKHAMKIEEHRVNLEMCKQPAEVKLPNAVEIIASAGIIEGYLSEGILTPASPSTVN